VASNAVVTQLKDNTSTPISFNYPRGIAQLSNGNIVVSDEAAHRIRLITPAGVVSTLAGSGTQTFADGTGTGASFNLPFGVAVIPSNGLIVIGDTFNNRIRLIDPTSGVVTTLAGNGSGSGFADGTGTAASFAHPYGVVVLSNGNIAVADSDNNRIRLISTSTYAANSGVVTTLAGNATAGSADGTGASATFNNPYGLAQLANGKIVVSENAGNRIRLISTSDYSANSGVVITIAGSGAGAPTSGAYADGTGTSASFWNPQGVAVIPSNGNIVIGDSGNNRVRLVSTSTYTANSGVVTTLAGSGSPALTDGTGTAAAFYLPSDCAVLSNGNILVSDFLNSRVRVITFPSLAAPTSLTLSITTGTANMSWTASSGATSYAWTLYNNGSNTSTYTGALVSGSNGTVTAPTVTATASGLTIGSNYYYTVSASNASGVSSVVASPIVEYFPNPYNLTLAVTSSNATMSWSSTGTSPTFYYVLTQTTAYSYTSGTTTTIATSNTTAMSATATFTAVAGDYYYFSIYESTAFGASPVYLSPITQYAPVVAFSPIIAVSGAQLWLDSADTSSASMTFSSGSNISVWKDKSSQANNFTISASGPPVRITDAGYSVVSIPSGCIMGSTSQITYTTSSAFFIVAKDLVPSAASGLNYLLDFGSADYSIRFQNSVLVGTQANPGGSSELANPYYVNGNYNPNYNSNYYHNAYAIIGTTTPTQSGTAYLSFSTSFLSRYFTGNIAEFLYYPAGITTPQRQQIEGYLAWKWGLQASLSNSHPYYSGAPVGTPSAPTSPTLAIASGTATLGWTVASGATNYNWVLYSSTTSNYNGTSNASGSASSPFTYAISSGLSASSNYYFTVASSNASGVSPTVASPIFTPTSSYISFLLVGGGGGGGLGGVASQQPGAGGGGGGGVVVGTSVLTSGTVYSIVVGAGGSNVSSSNATGGNGSNSSAFNVVAIGGGGGAGASASGTGISGNTGGSGGGAAHWNFNGTAAGGLGQYGQGFAGGSVTATGGGGSGGGGGGAGAAGSAGGVASGGAGGVGVSSAITGTSVYYGGGGGGAGQNTSSAGGTGGGGTGATNGTATSGTTNTGGGGGAAYGNTSGSGGSGVAIISIPTTSYTATYTGSVTVTTSGSNTILKFTGNGTYTA